METADIAPILIEVWDWLVASKDTPAATAFFEYHVVDGGKVVPALQRRQLARVLTSMTAEVAVPQPPDGGVNTVSCPSPTHRAPGGAPAPAVAPAADAAPRLPALPQAVTDEARPQTVFDVSRHARMLNRHWLLTGFVLRLAHPGQPVRRVPLNYSRIRVGTAHEAQDILLDLPDGATYQGTLEYQDGRFLLKHESGSWPTLVNNNEVVMAPIADGDVIRIGPVEMRMFRLLEVPAELIVAAGPSEDAGQRFVVDVSEVLLGRSGRRVNDIVLSSPTVSREHARIIFRDRKFWLVPETQTSLIAVNGEDLTAPRVLVDNDQVLLGEQTLHFRVSGPATRPRTLQSRTATVLFSDLRGWTSLAETMPLENLILQVNEYYKAMGDIITRYGGTLMTYQGDAIMAVFGAPSRHADDPWRAVASAVQMQAELASLNEQWLAAGQAALTGGIGIHTGQVMVGELGHSSRLEYSAMGDATNLAARLEQLTKEYQAPILISEATWQEVRDQVEAASIGRITVKGRTVPTEVFSVVAVKAV